MKSMGKFIRLYRVLKRPVCKCSKGQTLSDILDSAIKQEFPLAHHCGSVVEVYWAAKIFFDTLPDDMREEIRRLRE